MIASKRAIKRAKTRQLQAEHKRWSRTWTCTKCGQPIGRENYKLGSARILLDGSHSYAGQAEHIACP